MSSALSLVKGRGMSRRLRTVLPLAFTSKHPLRGFSPLITTVAEGTSLPTSSCSLAALVLKAPQDLHASMSTDDELVPLTPAFATAPAAFFAGAFAEAFLIVFLGAIGGGVWK